MISTNSHSKPERGALKRPGPHGALESSGLRYGIKAGCKKSHARLCSCAQRPATGTSELKAGALINDAAKARLSGLERPVRPLAGQLRRRRNETAAWDARVVGGAACQSRRARA